MWVLSVLVTVVLYCHGASTVVGAESEEQSLLNGGVKALQSNNAEALRPYVGMPTGLAWWPDGISHEKYLTEVCRDENGNRRIVALSLLCAVGSYGTLEPLANALQSSNATESELGGYGLSLRQGDPRSGPLLVSAFDKCYEAGDIEHASTVAYDISRTVYQGGAGCMTKILEKWFEGKWWTRQGDGIEAGRFEFLFRVLTGGQPESMTGFCNGLLRDMAKEYLSGDTAMDSASWRDADVILDRKTVERYWNEETLRLLGQIAFAGESGRAAETSDSDTRRKLRENARGTLENIPCNGGKGITSTEELTAFLEKYRTPADAYVAELEWMDREFCSANSSARDVYEVLDYTR